jgi:hypothetical protein
LSPNPLCHTIYGDTLCITAFPTGLQFTWHDTYVTRQRNGSEDYIIQPEWTSPKLIAAGVNWFDSKTKTVFVRLKKADCYQGNGTISNPKGGYGYILYYRYVVPEAGYSNLKVTTTSLPPTTQGVHYSFRYSVTGGVKPYHWIPIISLPKGLTLIQSGPKAGTLFGVPLVHYSYGAYIPLIVRDKLGHSAYTFLTLQMNP